MTKTFGRWAVALLALACLCRPARADVAERVEHLNKKAMEDYDALEFESAKRTLLDCVTKLRGAGLDDTPLAAKTHMHLGIIYIAGFHDKGRGQQQFERALKIDPTMKLPATLATPELQEAWDAAVQALPRKKREKAREAQGQPERPAERPARPPEEPPAEARPPQPLPEALKHTPLEEAGVGQKINIYAQPTVSIARASLFYRLPGQEQYTEVAMGRSRRQPGAIVGQIPQGVATGHALQYYIEAYDAQGAVVGRQGSPESPFIVMIKGGQGAPRAGDDEDPLAGAKRDDARRRTAGAWRPHVYLDVGLGTGAAIIPADTTTEVAWYYDKAENRYKPARASSGGGIWSGLGLRLEVGGYVWRGLTLGVSARFEPYLNHNADSSENAARLCDGRDGGKVTCYTPTSRGQFGIAVLGKLRYQFLLQRVFRPFVHVGIGGGTWRGALNIDGSKPMSGGMVNESSPLQPTDLCSATYNGQTGDGRMPPECRGMSAGYNAQDPRPVAPNLNRVCPKDGPCIDAVLLGHALFGVGGGFYAGGKHAGVFLDASLLFAAGGAQFGTLFDVYVGPQFIF
jgi:hypothetical protein